MKPNNKYIVFVTASLFILCPVIHAQQKLSLGQCREMALQNNKSAAIAERTEDKITYESKSYFANFFPKISLSGLYLFSNSKMEKTINGNYLPTFVPDPATGQLKPNIVILPDGNPLIGADGNPVFKEYAYFPDMALSLRLNGLYTAGIQAEQPLYMGGKITAAYKMSLIGKEIARLNRNLTRAEIIVQTDEAYWTHLKTLELKKVALEFQKVVTELYRNVQNAYETGMKPKNDVLKVQVQVNKAELQLLQAENAIRLSRMNLCQVTGLPIMSDISIEESFDNVGNGRDAPWRVSTPNDYTARPEYSILEKQIELKNQQVKLVRSDFLPNVGLLANYGYTHGLDLNSTPLFDKTSFFAVVSVKIPVFHWGEGVNKVRAAKAEKQIMQLQRDDLHEKMNLEMTQALNRCGESELEVALTLRSLEQAEENRITSRNQYEVGLETLANYLEAQTLWQQAWMEMINAKISQQLNETYYLKATGGL
ncbi:membrane protein [Bacteroidia bacterium]|nr:membrane protein [Bacteroidia bacterium]